MMNKIRPVLVFKIFFIQLSILLISSCAFSQSMIHISSTIHYDVMNRNWPGYDITLIFKNSLGLRYSLMKEISFLETIVDNNQSVKKNTYEGDLTMPMFLKMIDFKTFQAGPDKIFDFISAYLGIGYSTLELTMTQKEYYADANNLSEITREETVNSKISAASLGLYGGDSILVVDLRLKYLKGIIEASDYENKETQFERWMMIVSIGIGY